MAELVRNSRDFVSSEECWETLFLVKIIKVLGEGGFSFVYLAQDEHSGVSIVPTAPMSKL